MWSILTFNNFNIILPSCTIFLTANAVFWLYLDDSHGKDTNKTLSRQRKGGREWRLIRNLLHTRYFLFASRLILTLPCETDTIKGSLKIRKWRLRKTLFGPHGRQHLNSVLTVSPLLSMFLQPSKNSSKPVFVLPFLSPMLESHTWEAVQWKVVKQSSGFSHFLFWIRWLQFPAKKKK